MKHFTIFSGITFSPKFTFAIDENGSFLFSDDVELSEIKERLTYQIDPSDYGCKQDTIDIYRRARNIYQSENK